MVPGMMGSWACVCSCGMSRGVRKRFRLKNPTGASSQTDDCFRLDAPVGWISRKMLSRKSYFRLCNEPDLVSSRNGPFSIDRSDCIIFGRRNRMRTSGSFLGERQRYELRSCAHQGRATTPSFAYLPMLKVAQG